MPHSSAYVISNFSPPMQSGGDQLRDKHEAATNDSLEEGADDPKDRDLRRARTCCR